jgi:hypothetical protein
MTKPSQHPRHFRPAHTLVFLILVIGPSLHADDEPGFVDDVKQLGYDLVQGHVERDIGEKLKAAEAKIDRKIKDAETRAKLRVDIAQLQAIAHVVKVTEKARKLEEQAQRVRERVNHADGQFREIEQRMHSHKAALTILNEKVIRIQTVYKVLAIIAAFLLLFRPACRVLGWGMIKLLAPKSRRAIA